MGTSLSGLTPATTFDGLLKTSDNEPLDGTLKAISTGEGTDTILQLSNSALSIGGATTIVGNGTDNTTTALLVQNSNSDDILNLTDGALATLGATGKQGEINLKRPQDGLAIGKIQGTNNGLYLTNQDASNHILIGNSSTRGVSVGDGSASAMGARFGIKGSGASAGTTSLLVQNSDGSDLLRVRDDGHIIIPPFRQLRGDTSDSAITLQGSTSMTFRSATKDFEFDTQNGTIVSFKNDGKVGIGETTPTARLHLKGSGNDNTTTALLVQNSDGNDILTIKDDRSFKISSSAGTVLDIDANGSQLIGTSSRATVFNGSASYFLRNLGVGETTPTAKLQVKGSGASAGTTALLVENSAGTDLLKVEDGGNIRLGGNMYASQYIFNSTATSTWMRFVPSTHQIELTANTNKMIVVKSNGVGINTDSADASAVLQADSTTQGFLPPRMTTTQRDAITTPAAGLMIYNTTTNKAQCYNGTAWQDLF